jgi:siderophore synthetase component
VTATASRPAALPVPGGAHLAPGAMAHAHRALVRKALAEFAHERLVDPRPDPAAGPDHWVLRAGPSTYRFRAGRLALDHWTVDAGSVVREQAGRHVDLDAQDLVLELHEALGIPGDLLGTYLEEIAATLAGAAWKHHHARHTAAALLEADFQTVESAMTEGHPAFVANNGRIGYGLTDHESYAPEAGRPVRLVWLAVRRDLGLLSLGEGLDEGSLYRDQLGDLLDDLEHELRGLGLDPAGYRYLPAHPWQWEHKLAITFAPDVAARRVVPLALSSTRYQAQQSLRTFFDLDHPERHYVKTAVAIQNMGFLRGLSPRYMDGTPAINDWVADLVRGDETLRECGFDVLREVAAIGYTGDVYHRAAAATSSTRTSAYQKMVAALWRESPLPRVRQGERLATMASLLHRDREGVALVGEMVRASGVGAEQWVASYLRAYLRPVVHCLLAHDLAFMPHGENVILVIEDHVPTRVLFKDIGEEVAVLRADPLPAPLDRICGDVPPQTAALSVFTDVFDGFLRFLAAILDEDGVLPEAGFWRLVGSCVAEHAVEHPHLHERIDLFAEEFDHSCLNRLQLRNTLQMVDLSDQVSSLQYAGTLANPIAPWRPARA